MNPFGSYRALHNNSKAAIVSAIEIYNKPKFSYRDECSIILLVNAWELLLKAILSKNRKRIYYPKKRNEKYRTLTIQDALEQAKEYFPKDAAFEPVAKNLDLLTLYRNNTIHFYNQGGISVVLYGLLQTCIVNYKDLMLAAFDKNIANEANIQLLPLSFGIQPDPIHFLQKAKANPPKSREVASFISAILSITQELESHSIDTARFLTSFGVSLQSVKKVSAADIVVGIDKNADGSAPTVIEKRINPNVSHEETQASIVKSLDGAVKGVRFTTFTFQAVVWKLQIKHKPHLCWSARNGAVTWYSSEVISLIKRLSEQEIESTVEEFKQHKRTSRLKK